MAAKKSGTKKSSAVSAEVKKFLDELSEEQAKVVSKLVATIALQAETIQDLNVSVRIRGGADALIDKKMSGVSLTALASKLDSPKVKAPTLKEIQDSIHQMQADIEKAKDLQQVMSTVVTFATRLAPLML